MRKEKVYMVTGGAGFIGSAVIRLLMKETGCSVVNVDKLTYAGNLKALEECEGLRNYSFEKADIGDVTEIERIFEQYRPDAVMHLAAESHVDRSIDSADEFMQTNIMGTYRLLEVARLYFKSLTVAEKRDFRFHHVSTDEVYGSLGKEGYFTERTAYRPNSPYSASKAASDHLARAWHQTYGLPVVISNCSNNYGPYQYPEKLIPLMINKALSGEQLPVYGKGENIRDWLYVEDHARALVSIINDGVPGEVYNVGGGNEVSNILVVRKICEILNELSPDPSGADYTDRICFVTDRPGHDLRYAIDASKIKNELGWRPLESFESGLRKTVRWYLDNLEWYAAVRMSYGGERLGMSV